MTTRSVLQIGYGTTSQVNAFTPAARELIEDVTTGKIHVGDGVTAGGGSVLATEAYLAAQIAAIASASAATFIQYLTCL